MFPAKEFILHLRILECSSIYIYIYIYIIVIYIIYVIVIVDTWPTHELRANK